MRQEAIKIVLPSIVGDFRDELRRIDERTLPGASTSAEREADAVRRTRVEEILANLEHGQRKLALDDRLDLIAKLSQREVSYKLESDRKVVAKRLAELINQVIELTNNLQ